MKCYRKKLAGVTLLEILLVLAIAAMIIIMSIRYYQSATQSEQANVAMEEIQAIAAAADNLALGAGSYSTTVSTNAISNVVGSANMITPNGQDITITSVTATSYGVKMPLGTTVCASVDAKLAGNSKITGASCDSTGTLTYTYDNTK